MISARDPRTTRAAIDDFLAHRRIALVGLSTRPDHFSRAVYSTLRDHGFDVVPVNTRAEEIDGQRCFGSVEDISPGVQGALLMTPPEASLQVVEQCARSGVNRVWMHRGAGVGAVSQEAVDYCDSHGISVVAGQCPLMFVGDPPDKVHQIHASAKRLWGTYPASHAPPVNLATLLYALVGWMVCAAVLYTTMAWLSLNAALVVHAAAAMLVFGALSARYHRVRPNADSRVTALVFTGVVVALDAVIVALLVERSFAMFASPLGTWIPFALIFSASWLAGRKSSTA